MTHNMESVNYHEDFKDLNQSMITIKNSVKEKKVVEKSLEKHTISSRTREVKITNMYANKSMIERKNQKKIPEEI